MPTISAGSVIETALFLKKSMEVAGWIRDVVRKCRTPAGVRSADENDESLMKRQLDGEPPARNVRKKLCHDGGVQVYTTGDEDGRDSNDSRAITPPEIERVWAALYSVEQEDEKGSLLRQLRHELEGSKMLTFA